MKLIISNVSGVPIYEQIKQQIKAAILSGELQAEETLPSLRTLAKDLKISVLTVTKAYTELEQLPLLQEYSYLHSIPCSRFRDITSTAQSKDGYLCIFQWPVFW